MSHFFVEPEQISGGTVTITGTDVNHIKNVLRKKQGDVIIVSDGRNTDFTCRICDISQELVSAQIISADENASELPARIVLFQGLPKSDKMELIIQKAVELGAAEIVPVAMKNCVMKIVPQKAEAKVKRWRAIAESAAKQSGRNFVPEVAMPMTFSQALEYGASLDVKLLPYENQRGMEHTRCIMRQCVGKKSIGVWIGPEGGYAPEEIDRACAAGWTLVSLGRRILRTETAGLAALAMLIYVLDE